MKGRKIKVSRLFVVALVMVVLGVFGMLFRPAGKQDQVLAARFGDVVWNHELHSHLEGVKCITCHHRYGKDEEDLLKEGVIKPVSCLECHEPEAHSDFLVLKDVYMEDTVKTEGGNDVPSARVAFHNKCINCHNAESEGPVACYDCHEQSFSGRMGRVAWSHRVHSRKMGEDCTSCHHQDTDAEWAGEYTNCRECHEHGEAMGVFWESNIKDHGNVKHGECGECHTIENPEKGVRSCGECHDSAEMAGREGAPSLEYAVHYRCMDCHRDENPDLPRPAPDECAECHSRSPSFLEGSTMGTVLWSHTRHNTFTPWTCNKCHHTAGREESLQLACDRCHGKEDFSEAGTLENAMHQNCGECHRQKGAGPDPETDCMRCHSENPQLGLMFWDGKEGPVWWDHRRHAENMNFSCRECHHNTIVEQGLPVICEDLPDCPPELIEPQPCANCHPLSEEQGQMAGGQMMEMDAPPLGEAVHASCIECHRRMGSGPIKCEECHVKQ
ncbi:MAG: cytochrome c3 family protein [bacterium]